ncbi:MAG: hypothetical protein M3O76_04740 [Actinomycetota bacterium]|nr:hypothetical protein [Actinomycetota bacterium]
MKKIAATVIAGVLLAAVPAIAAQTSRSAPATDGFLTIGGPNRLTPQANLRVPIRCAIACKTTALTTLTTPNDTIGPEKAHGHLGAGVSRKLVVTLNDAAKGDIEAHPNSRLRVGVSAVSDSSGEHVHTVKVFRFTSTAP